ncbi:MAG: VOC family protein [Planctomycetota bacterium]
MFKRIDHVEIVVKELEEPLEFYTDVLGFQVAERRELAEPPADAPIQEIVYLTLGDTALELILVKNAPGPAPGEWRAGYRMMALEVEDLDATVQHCEENGVEVTWGPVEMQRYRRAEIEDPAGFPLELREWTG